MSWFGGKDKEPKPDGAKAAPSDPKPSAAAKAQQQAKSPSQAPISADAEAGASGEGLGATPPAAAFDRRVSAVWDAVAVSTIGSSHEKRGHPRQDSFVIACVDEFVVAAVADGLGSSPHSETGSRIACESVSGQLANELAGRLAAAAKAGTPLDPAAQEEIARKACADARARLHALGRSLPWEQGKPDPLETTLLVAAVWPEGGFFVHIGDGVALALNAPKDGEFDIVAVSEAENGEYANITFPLTMPDYERHLRFTVFGPCELAVLMSDGVMPFMLGPDQASPEPETMWAVYQKLRKMPGAAGVQELVKLLLSEKAGEISSDDKTLLLICRKPRGA